MHKKPSHLGWLNRSAALVLTAGCCAFFGATAARGDFFRPAPDPASELPPDLLYPQGRLFPFGFFSVGGGSLTRRGELLPEEEVQQALRDVRAQGVTALGPQYELNDRILADSAQHGYKAMYTVRPRREDGSDWNKDDLVGKTDEELIAAVRHEMEIALSDPNEAVIGWWYLQPEELRHWREREMAYLELATRTIREMDPRGRPIWMYDPGHRTAGALTHTARHLDVVGKGMYTNYSGRREMRVWCRWTIEQQNQAIAEVNPSALSLAVAEMFRDPGDLQWPLIRPWVRHDAYLALISGAQGISIFSRSHRPQLSPHAHRLYSDAWGEVATELCGELGLGQVFLFGERRDDLSVEVVEGPALIDMEYRRSEETYPSVAHLDVAYGNQRYLFLVNSANDPVQVTVHGVPDSGVRIRSLFVAEDEHTEIIPDLSALAFEPFEVKAFLVERE